MTTSIDTASALGALTPGTWNVDPSHSTVSFTARHLMITKVRGRFSEFSGEVVVGEDPLSSTVRATVQLASVDTGDDGRDTHLRSADFLDVETFPTMEFRSTGVRADGGNYVLDGELTLKGVTKPVSFELDFDGVNADPWNNTKAAFSARTVINRKDWGLEWKLDIQAVKV
jgi:polyisoprenoid-binding protein YceI